MLSPTQADLRLLQQSSPLTFPWIIPQAITAALPLLRQITPDHVMVGASANGFKTTTSEWLNGGTSSGLHIPAGGFDNNKNNNNNNNNNNNKSNNSNDNNTNNCDSNNTCQPGLGACGASLSSGRFAAAGSHKILKPGCFWFSWQYSLRQ